MSSAQRLRSRKRTAKRKRQYRNKNQVEDTKENKKKLCIELHDFFFKKEKEAVVLDGQAQAVGWWWLLGY